MRYLNWWEEPCCGDRDGPAKRSTGIKPHKPSPTILGAVLSALLLSAALACATWSFISIHYQNHRYSWFWCAARFHELIVSGIQFS